MAQAKPVPTKRRRIRSLSPKQAREDSVSQALLLAQEAPLTVEHLAAIEKARNEASNENIELARAMTKKQRKAFQRKYSA